MGENEQSHELRFDSHSVRAEEKAKLAARNSTSPFQPLSTRDFNHFRRYPLPRDFQYVTVVVAVIVVDVTVVDIVVVVDTVVVVVVNMLT